MKNLSEAILDVLKGVVPMNAREITNALRDKRYKDFHGVSQRSVVVCLTFALSGRGVDRIKVKGVRPYYYTLSLIH